MHKFLGVRPRNVTKTNCNLCFQKLQKDKGSQDYRPYRWYQGRPYHEDCFQEEMKKPLYKRFNKKG